MTRVSLKSAAKASRDRFVPIVLVSLLLFQLPAASQSQRKSEASKPERKLVTLKRSPASLVMAKAFSEGKLPEPAPLPPGNVDRQAITLAKAVTGRDDSSSAALYAAILAAGFAVRNADGTLQQIKGRAQGLVFDSWQIAATAKLYGENYGVMLSHLSETFVRTVPEFKDLPLADALLDGIRKGTTSTDPSVRFLSRFIVELGKNGKPASDLLGNVDPRKTRLDAIQVALILNRLSGDLAVLEKKTARVNYSHASPPNWQSPCGTSETQDLILDANALASTTLFGILAQRLGGKLESYGGKVGIANIVAAVVKFIATYAMLNVEITMNGDMLVRTRSSTSTGEVKTLTAKLKIDSSPWEKLNCLRTVFNAAGLDIEFPKSGPLEDTTVLWSIVLGGDSRGGAGAFVDWVKGEDNSDNLIFLKPKPGADAMPNNQKADKNGVSEIDVVGAAQKEDLSNRKVFEVNKPAGVTVGVQIKPTKIKDVQGALSNLNDILGNAISFFTGDPVGGGLGVVFETMYRSNWYSAEPFYFIVKDWEPCKGQWTGTITYSTSLKEVGSAESFVVKQSWDDESHYDANAQLDGRKDNLGAPLARVQATASLKKVRFSTGKNGCYRATTQIQEIHGSETATTTGFSITVNGRSGEYHVSAPVFVVEGKGTSSVDSVVQGTCNNPYNKDDHHRNPETGFKLSPEGPIVQGIGKIDPNNPDVISGTNTVTVPTNNGGERTATIHWSLRRCQDQ